VTSTCKGRLGTTADVPLTIQVVTCVPVPGTRSTAGRLRHRLVVTPVPACALLRLPKGPATPPALINCNIAWWVDGVWSMGARRV